MQTNHLIWWSNLALALCSFLVITFALYFYTLRTPIEAQLPIKPRSTTLPQHSFAFKEDQLRDLGQKALQLEFQIPTIRIPDLRQLLSYNGKNSRPDAGISKEMFFSLGVPPIVMGGEPNSPIYLQMHEGGQVSFSPNNNPSDLWFTARPQGNAAQIEVKIRDEAGVVHQEPKDRANFTLPEKPLAGGAQNWNIDALRVDGTLLMRQGAKWSGRDLFLEKHGGEEYFKDQGKQRITFGEGDQKYSVYVDKGDDLIWKEGRWRVPEKGEKTDVYPLMHVDKVEERVMGATLYDLLSKHKTPLNLLKSVDPIPPVSVADQFQFVGARTRLHSTFKVGNQREVVGPEDWFILTSDGWKKIKTGKEVDDYVVGKLTGPLLVIERIEKQNENKWLQGTLYNSSRSNTVPVELPLKLTPIEHKKEEVKEKATEERRVMPLEQNQIQPRPAVQDLPAGAVPERG